MSCFASLVSPATSLAQAPRFNGAKALDYARQLVACGPRFNGSPGLACAQNFLRKQFTHDNLQDDSFTASTPAGLQSMHNFIVRFPGKKDGIIVLATHYETNYNLRDTSFIGANDGAATTGLLLEIANHLRGRELDGYSVWLVFYRWRRIRQRRVDPVRFALRQPPPRRQVAERRHAQAHQSLVDRGHDR